jgi:polysaccharide pyruvyl transferase WcaK-like protein
MASPSGYAKVLDSLDCILDIGAGDSFADIYGAKRFSYLWLTKAVAIAKGKPLLMSPQTIGPFSKRPYSRLAAWAMRRAFLVVARDELSLLELQRIAPDAKTLLSADVAFELPYRRAARAKGRTRVGLNVSGLLFNHATRGIDGHGLTYNYADMSRQLLRDLSKSDSLDVELICHVSAPSQSIDDDGLVADQLAREFPSVKRVESFASPSDAKSFISGLDFLISGRMHSCIAAFSSGVPFVATAYSRKFDGLFGMLEYPATMPRRGIETKEAVAYVLGQLSNRHSLAAALERGNARVRKLIADYEEALSNFFLFAAKQTSSTSSET